MLNDQTIYTCYTLFDIKDRGSRSETRNWNTLIQILSLRTQPFIIKFPDFVEDNLENYKFGVNYSGLAKIWSFEFQIEHDVFQVGNDPIANLIKDTNFVPLLDKNLIIKPPCCLQTDGENKNIYYVYNNTL